MPGCPRRLSRRTPRLFPVVALLLAGGLLLSACGGTQYTYAGSTTLKNSFRVPSGWHQFSRDDVARALGLQKDPNFDQHFPFLVAFDAAPHPDIKHITAGNEFGPYPSVLAYVRQLPFGEHDTMSLRSMRNAVYSLDQAEDGGLGDTLSYDPFTLPGGFYGSKTYFIITGTTPTDTNPKAELAQIAATNPGAKYLYLLVVRCTAPCFNENKAAIDDIVNSWNIEE